MSFLPSHINEMINLGNQYDPNPHFSSDIRVCMLRRAEIIHEHGKSSLATLVYFCELLKCGHSFYWGTCNVQYIDNVLMLRFSKTVYRQFIFFYIMMIDAVFVLK